jgi:predicted CoA-substrate-specific enzyme activase
MGQEAKAALEAAGVSMSDLSYVISTGYGRNGVAFANKAVTEIICHARGVNFLIPAARTVIDIGGQDSKVIRVREQGSVSDFVMNDKCAAGAGRSMGIMAELVDVPLEELGAISLQSNNGGVPISSTCVVFARSEVLGYLRQGVPKYDVLAGACQALTSRVQGLLKRVGMEEDFVISGGIAKNIGVVRRLENEIGVKGLTNPKADPQIAGGIGAALFAKAMAEKQKKIIGVAHAEGRGFWRG